MNELSNLQAPRGANISRKRLGRGAGSGLGKTAGRGHKGQLARKSPDVGTGFEGGQMPLQRRLPKIGFTNIFRTRYASVNVGDLAIFPAGTTVDEAALRTVGLVRGRWDGVKILGDGDLDRALTVVADKFSQSAQDKIAAAGGKVQALAAASGAA
jgi:large subunit ribosomal protein L15